MCFPIKATSAPKLSPWYAQRANPSAANAVLDDEVRPEESIFRTQFADTYEYYINDKIKVFVW